MVHNDAVKKAMYDKLVPKINAVDTTVPGTNSINHKTQYDTAKQNLEKKIEHIIKKLPNTSGQVRKTDLNIKIVKIENKISIVIGLVTTTALNAKVIEIESKIPHITNLATKPALNAKAAEIENKKPNTSNFVNTNKFNRYTEITFDARMKGA